MTEDKTQKKICSPLMAACMVAAAAGFTVMLCIVLSGRGSGFDDAVRHAFYSIRAGWLTPLVKALTYMGSYQFIIGPVSYTHLDVYKRQVSGGSSGGCRRCACDIHKPEKHRCQHTVHALSLIHISAASRRILKEGSDIIQPSQISISAASWNSYSSTA